MKKLSLLVSVLIVLFCLNYTVKHQWKGFGGEYWKSIISGDGCGYYSYLPCLFIYHSFDYKKIKEEEGKVNPNVVSGTTNNVFITSNGKTVDQYMAGVSILLAPFFLLAYLLSYLFGFELSGYSMLFTYSISIGALFYLFIGLLYLRKLLLEYSISEWTISLTLLLIVFGTNLFFYSTMDASMSHTYSFGLSAMFLYYAKRSINGVGLKNLLICAVIMGILFLIRPTNLFTILIVPFLANNPEEFKTWFKGILSNNKKEFLFAILSVAGILFLQCILWFMQTGHLFIWSYPQSAGFNFARPRFIDILFSYQNGLFIYSPLILLAILGGLAVLLKRNLFNFVGFLFFFVFITYFLSSWFAWYYGGFGAREFIDYYPVFAILLALLLNEAKPILLNAGLVLAGLCCVILNVVQTYQMRNFILTYSYMDKTMYQKVFMNTNDSCRGIFFRPQLAFNPFADYKNDFERNGWGNEKNITTEKAHIGTHSAFVDSELQYSPTFRMKAGQLPASKNPAVLIKLWVYMDNFANNASLVMCMNGRGDTVYNWTSYSIKGSVDETGAWHEVQIYRDVPAYKNPADLLAIYVWTTKGKVYIDDMEIKFGERIPATKDSIVSRHINAGLLIAAKAGNAFNR